MHTYVILTAVRYDGMKQRPQHIADFLSEKGNKVVYVNLNKRMFLEPTIYDGLFALTDVSPYISQVNSNLLLMDRLEKRVAGQTLGLDELLARIERFYGSSNTTFWVAYPEWVEYIGLLSQETYLIYDCIDDWDEFVHDIQWHEKMVTLQERKMASLSDLVITSSKRLFAKMSKLNPNVYYLPNGVNPEDYAKEVVVPVDLKNIPKPYVFFMGALAGWVDVSLIEYLARSRPTYSFVFVGNQHKTALPELNNIHFLGLKPYSELVHYVKQASVAIIPFKVNRLTASVTPLKFYEYISAGTPAITTLLPDLVGVRGSDIASGYDDFLGRIDYYVKMKSAARDALCDELVAASKEFAWAKLLGDFLDVVSNQPVIGEFRDKFVESTIADYERNHAMHPSLINELLSFYNLRSDYAKTVKLGTRLAEQTGTYDREQLALALFKQDQLEETIKCLDTMFKERPALSYYPKFFEWILEQSDEVILEAFLLKVCGYVYEAMNLLDRALMEDESPSVSHLGLMASLYCDIYEFSAALKFLNLALETVSQENVLYDPYMIINLVAFLVKSRNYEVAELLALHLYSHGLTEEAEEQLTYIYFYKHLPS